MSQVFAHVIKIDYDFFSFPPVRWLLFAVVLECLLYIYYLGFSVLCSTVCLFSGFIRRRLRLMCGTLSLSLIAVLALILLCVIFALQNLTFVFR
jgi:hypothetical protein